MLLILENEKLNWTFAFAFSCLLAPYSQPTYTSRSCEKPSKSLICKTWITRAKTFLLSPQILRPYKPSTRVLKFHNNHKQQAKTKRYHQTSTIFHQIPFLAYNFTIKTRKKLHNKSTCINLIPKTRNEPIISQKYPHTIVSNSISPTLPSASTNKIQTQSQQTHTKNKIPETTSAPIP